MRPSVGALSWTNEAPRSKISVDRGPVRTDRHYKAIDANIVVTGLVYGIEAHLSAGQPDPENIIRHVVWATFTCICADEEAG